MNNLSFKLLLLVSLVGSGFAGPQNSNVTVYLVGDSTMSEKEVSAAHIGCVSSGTTPLPAGGSWRESR